MEDIKFPKQCDRSVIHVATIYGGDYRARNKAQTFVEVACAVSGIQLTIAEKRNSSTLQYINYLPAKPVSAMMFTSQKLGMWRLATVST